MRKSGLFIFIFCFSLQISSQNSPISYEYQAFAIGGLDQIEQVLQTQFTLPKSVNQLKFNDAITVFLNVDSLGNATNLKVDGAHNRYITNETLRMFHFLKFKRTLNLPDEPRPYFITFNLSSEKYNKYVKQKSKFNLKNNLAVDSSYVIYTKADKSPEYYKNGEEGLKEFLISEMEYPKIAIEKTIGGTVILEFVVETNGYLTDIVVKKGVNGGCTEEALRLIKKTKWQPAVINNKYVRYKMTYPITFSLQNKARENSSSGTIGQ